MSLYPTIDHLYILLSLCIIPCTSQMLLSLNIPWNTILKCCIGRPLKSSIKECCQILKYIMGKFWFSNVASTDQHCSHWSFLELKHNSQMLYRLITDHWSFSTMTWSLIIAWNSNVVWGDQPAGRSSLTGHMAGEPPLPLCVRPV